MKYLIRSEEFPHFLPEGRSDQVSDPSSWKFLVLLLVCAVIGLYYDFQIIDSFQRYFLTISQLVGAASAVIIFRKERKR